MKSGIDPLQRDKKGPGKSADHTTWVLAGLRSKGCTYKAGLGQLHEEIFTELARTKEVCIDDSTELSQAHSRCAQQPLL